MATKVRQPAGTKEEFLQLHRWMCTAKALDDWMQRPMLAKYVDNVARLTATLQ